MNPRDLIRIAKHLAAGLVGPGRGRPRQTDLCRAVSACYYALFHTLVRCGADTLAGSTRSIRSQPAWRQTYQALEHRPAKNQCSNPSVMKRFPTEIQAFGELFVTMQRERHFADYDPSRSFSRSQVMQLIDETERVIKHSEAADRRYQRAFAIYVLFRLRQN